MELRLAMLYHPMTMTRRRRATASLLLLLLFQMLGLGSGVLRAAPDASVDADCAGAMAQETGSPMGDMPMPATDGAPDSPDHESRPPCGLPWAPLGCASAAACLPAIVPVEQFHGTAVTVAHLGVLAVNDATPESLVRAPELPPPRA